MLVCLTALRQGSFKKEIRMKSDVKAPSCLKLTCIVWMLVAFGFAELSEDTWN